MALKNREWYNRSMNAQRQEFLIRCLNAAANLYGIVSYSEFTMLYNRYSAGKDSPVSDLLQPDEIDEMMELPDPDDFDLESDELWFARAEVDGTTYVVSRYGFCCDPDDGRDEVDDEGVRGQLADFVTPDLKVLSEEDFLFYDEPKAFEETGVTKKFAKFLRQEYGYGKDEAEFAVWDVQEELRYAPSIKVGMISARNTLGLEVVDLVDFDDLVDALMPLVRNTRTWDYRGYTETELVNAGVLKAFRPDNSDEVLGLFFDDSEADGQSGSEDENDEKDWEEDAWDTGRLSDDELAEILPPADYPKGPVDFSFVKDREKRERALADYQNVRNVTGDFVREVVVKALTDKARQAAARRLGFPKAKAIDALAMNYDMIAGDFAAMMDDQDGEPLIRRILAHSEKLSKYHRLGAAYYANYKYAWLVVDAVKAGIGLKCRNLMNGEELFLMEMSRSCDADVKGSTFCAGIAPMGDVYLCLGTMHPANFEPSEAVHKMVRQKLGLPLEGPLDLSIADQARFAEEVIRRIDALGKFKQVGYGGF